MTKDVVIVNGEIYSVGTWDYQKSLTLVAVDEEGNPIYENIELNPLPEGATIEKRDMEYDPDRGWFEVGTEPTLNFTEDMRRTLTDIFALLVNNSVLNLNEVPSYKEYDFKSAVQKKSDLNA